MNQSLLPRVETASWKHDLSVAGLQTDTFALIDVAYRSGESLYWLNRGLTSRRSLATFTNAKSLGDQDFFFK